MKQQISRRPERSLSLSNSLLTGSITRYPTLSTSDPNLAASVCTPARCRIPSPSARVPAQTPTRKRVGRFCERSGALLLRSLDRRGGSAVNGTGAERSDHLVLTEREPEMRAALSGEEKGQKTHLGRATSGVRASASASARRRRTSAADSGRHSAANGSATERRQASTHQRGEATPLLCARSSGERRSRTRRRRLT